MMKFLNSTTFVSSLTLSLALTGMVMAVPQELVDRLGDENYHLREKAEKELMQWADKEGEKSLSKLSKLKSEAQSPEVKSRLDSVIASVKGLQGTRGFMGVDLDSVLGGSLINSVTPDSPAAKAGLQPNDKIIGLDEVDLLKKNKDVGEATEFLRVYVKKKRAGQKLKVKIDRGGKILTAQLKLGDYDKFMAGQNALDLQAWGGRMPRPPAIRGMGGVGGLQIEILPQGGAIPQNNGLEGKIREMMEQKMQEALKEQIKKQTELKKKQAEQEEEKKKEK